MSQYSLPSGRRPARKSLAAFTRSLSCGDPRKAQGGALDADHPPSVLVELEEDHDV
jgi:hypothetical protein